MKHFLIIGNKNALFWKGNFNMFMEGTLKWGYNRINRFRLPDDAEKWEWLEEGDKVCNLQGTGRWYTDLPVERVGEILPYSYNDCQKFDFFDAVNTDDRYSIPDTDGIIGVPIDFLSIYSPEQFEIVGMLMNGKDKYDFAQPYVGGKKKYTRLLIKRK